MSKDTEAPPQESPDSEAPPVPPPLEVKITNHKQESKWNDSQDSIEYEEIVLTEEDMDI